MSWLVCTAVAAGAALIPGCGSSTTTSTAPSTISRCAVSLGPTSVSVPAEGSTGRIAVTTERECAWSAAAEGSWLSIMGPNSGQGDGGVEFRAASNSDPATRRGSIVLNNQRVDVTQAAGVCTLQLRQSSASYSPGGGSGIIELTASSPMCTWTVSADADWVTITSAPSGSGSGSIRYSVAPTAGPPRTATITAGGQRFSVVQSEGCSYTIAPTTGSVSAAGGGDVATVSTAPGCPWTAASNVPWITVTQGASGTGPGNVSFTAEPLEGPARTGTLVIAGETFTLSQSAGCAYEVSPLTHAAPGAGGTFTVNVGTAPGCGWQASSGASWLTIAGQSSGSGSGAVTITVAASTGDARTGTLSVAGRTVTVAQAQGCTFTIAPESQSVASSGGTGTVNVTSPGGCAWSARSNVDWMTVTEGASGTGNGTVRFSVAASNGQPRTGTLTIAGRTFTVNQSQACSYTLDRETAPASASGGALTVSVSAGAGCAWSATSNAQWLTVREGGSGSGNGTVRIEIAANTGAPRTGTVTIAGRTFTVEQAGTCAYTLSSDGQSVPSSGGTGTVDVATAAGCGWTASSGAPWITVTSGASGTGNGRVAFTVASNTGAPRTGTIAIAGRTFTITQAGSCSFTIAPQQHNRAAQGGTVDVQVTAAAGCAWTAVSEAPWIAVTSGASGSGNGVVRLTIAANTGTARTGTVRIAGQAFVVQQAAPCTFAVSPSSRSSPRSGGPGMFNVTTATGCSWTAVSNAPWIALVGDARGTGSGRVDYVVQANPTTTERKGTITVEGQTFVVVQSGS